MHSFEPKNKPLKQYNLICKTYHICTTIYEKHRTGDILKALQIMSLLTFPSSLQGYENTIMERFCLVVVVANGISIHPQTLKYNCKMNKFVQLVGAISKAKERK